MKKIYSNIKTLAALLVAGAAFTACSSSDSENIIEQPEAPSVKTYKLIVEASKDGSLAFTRALAEDGKGGLTTTWGKNDQVYLYINNDISDIVNRRAELKPTDLGKNSTILTANTIFDYEELVPNKELTLTYLAPDESNVSGNVDDNDYRTQNAANYYKNQDGTLTYIEKHCNFAIATTRIASIDNVNNQIYTSPAYFENQQAIIKLTLTVNGGAPISVNNVHIEKAGSDISSFQNATAKDVIYLAIPECNTNGLYIYVADTEHSKTLTIDKKLEKGKFYNMNVDFIEN